MAWVVGIDEAGYGPNLGPFVMSSVTLQVPEELAGANLWRVLRRTVCRANHRKNGRIVVDDSKAIYSAGGALAVLEKHLLPFALVDETSATTLEDYWLAHCNLSRDGLGGEPWHHPGLVLPLHQELQELRSARDRLLHAFQRNGIALGAIQSVVVFPQSFNRMVDRHDSKAAVPGWALTQLLAPVLTQTCGTTTRVFVDKLGGRNHYHQLLQEGFPEYLVMQRDESALRSCYRVLGGSMDCEITFLPRADGTHFPTALASMASKYLREVLMHQFNQFWERQVPGLKPTAGYPGDAARFYQDIAPVRKRLGIADEMLWRAR